VNSSPPECNLAFVRSLWSRVWSRPDVLPFVIHQFVEEHFLPFVVRENHPDFR
jgi:hypothetical protein